MRKVLSFVLVLALVLSSFSMAFAADVEVPSIVLTDIAGEDYEQAAQTLIDLGVVTGYADKTFGGDRDVTRAEMAAMVCKALGLNGGGYNSFPDARTHWASEWIGLAQSLGIITGYEDGTFKPDNNVTYYETLAMLIKALGYNDDSLPGTWPNKYIAQASKLGISDGVTIGGSNANRGDVATMLYQTLDQQTGKTNKDGLWVGDIRRDNNEDYAVTMYILLGMSFNDEEVISLDMPSRINLLPYVGALAEYYTNKDGEIVAIYEVKTTFLSGTYDVSSGSNPIFETDDVNYSFGSAADNTTVGSVFMNAQSDNYGGYLFVTASQSSPGITLGGIYDGAGSGYMSCVIAAELTGKRIDKIHSINVWIENGGSKLADENDLADIRDDKSLLGGDFPLDGNGDIDYKKFHLFGVNSLDEIEVDNVIAVYEDGTDNIITKVEVGTETVSGEVSKITVTQTKVTMDGTTYDVSGLVGSIGNASLEFEVGNEVKLFLDYNGEFFDAEIISGTANLVGVVLDFDDGSNFDDARIRLFTADGSNTVFNVDSDATYKLASSSGRITNINWTSTTAISNSGIHTMNPTPGALIKYSLNKNGDINAFEEFENVSGSVNGISNTSGKISAKGAYSGYEIAKNAVIFTTNDMQAVTDGSLKANMLGTTALEKILDSDIVAGYYGLKDGKISALILDSTGLTESIYGVAFGWGKNKSDAEHYVNMLVDGKAVEYNIDSTEYSKLISTGKAILFAVTFNAAGDAKLENDLDSFGADPPVVLLAIDAAIGGVTQAGLLSSADDIAATWKGNVLTVQFTGAASGALTSFASGGSITVDADAIVYVWDNKAYSGSTGYVKGTRADLRSGAAMAFFDTDGDGVADIVLKR